MESKDLYKVEKTETLTTDDGEQSMFVVAGTSISMDQARVFGLVSDDRAKLLKQNADRAKEAGSADNTNVGPESERHQAFLAEQEEAAQAEAERVNADAKAQLGKASTRNKGAAPENRSA